MHGEVQSHQDTWMDPQKSDPKGNVQAGRDERGTKAVTVLSKPAKDVVQENLH